MRFLRGNPERAKANLKAGRERARLAAVAFRGPPLRPPAPGTLLKRIRVEDCFAGLGYILDIRQGNRRNNIAVFRNGIRVNLRHGSGMDALFRRLRHDWALRWLVLN
jgi:hypothetical protein